MNKKIQLFSVLILFFWVFIIYRLYTLQIKEGSSFQVQAIDQQGYQSTIPTTRGTIQSSDGVELAINKPTFNAYIYTPNITNKSIFTTTILPKLHMSENDFSKALAKGEKYFLANGGINPDEKSELQKLLSTTNQGSVVFSLQETRLYPNGTLLSQTLGFENMDTLQGNYGLEGYFDGDLKGLDGKVNGNKDQFGNVIANQNFNFVPPTLGENLTLTINADLQKTAETKLQYWVQNQEADSGSVIIMDPKTGAILAMANYPTFDPNAYSNGYILDCTDYLFKSEDVCNGKSQKLPSSLLQSSFDNQAIANVYEPGSVMKAITAAAALEDKKIDSKTTIDDKSGVYEANTEKVYNYNKKPDGVMNMAEILKQSSNVGASLIAQMVGKNEMYKFYEKFGIGNQTGVTLQGEQTGTIPDASSWQDIDLATASFGQYIGATPLQVIGIYQAIANQGVRMQPYIVSQYEKGNQIISYSPTKISQVISPSTANTLTDMLTYTTTGEPAYALRNMKEFIPIIAGKTGSAQVPLPNKAGYYDNIINATYVGYAPAKNPKFVMLTVLKSPRAGIYASTTVVPLWADIAKDLFTYFKIPPSPTVTPTP